MSTRTSTKQGRNAWKTSLKTSGKDLTKGEKLASTVFEIVPGKFSEQDWFSVLENEDTEDFISDIFESIWFDVSKKIEQIYVRRQLLPFTLQMTENALSNVIEWAFLQKDSIQLGFIDVIINDSGHKPIACTMDNWGEGVVPAYREAISLQQTMEESSSSSSSANEHPYNLPAYHEMTEKNKRTDRDSEGFSKKSVSQQSETNLQMTEDAVMMNIIENVIEKTSENQLEEFQEICRELIRKEISPEETIAPYRLEQRPYHHDVLVIDTQPPTLEPLSSLFFSTLNQTDKALSKSNTNTLTSKSRHPIEPQASSQLGSSTAATTTITSSTTSRAESWRKPVRSKFANDVSLEKVTSKAPLATHPMLKAILSRPPGFRDLEFNDNGDVIAIAEIDPDKMLRRKIRVKCEIIQPRKGSSDKRSIISNKRHPSTKKDRSESKSTSNKIILPENSTEVGDLIQPVPGVLYEDRRLRKGDPRRYQSGLSKYKNFHDENRLLKPLGQRNDLKILEKAQEFIRITKLQSKDETNDVHASNSKLNRFNQIPPILPATKSPTI